MAALLAPRGTFTGTASPVPDDAFARMHGKSWRDDPLCPPRDVLAYLELDHRTLDGGDTRGELVVSRRIAAETLGLFRRLWAIGFPVARMTLVDDFDADDGLSMAADNCSAFNFRVVAGTDELSQHAFGLAIDINPVQNPWVQPERFVPAAGAPYLDRADLRAGMIVRPGPVVRILDELGWEWGGDWKHARDYHHIVWRR